MAGLFNTDKEDTSPGFKLADEGTATPPASTPEEQDLRKKEQTVSKMLTKKKQSNLIKGKGTSTPSFSANEVDLPRKSSFDINNLAAVKDDEKVRAFPMRSLEMDGVTSIVRPPKEEGWGIKTYDFLFGSEAAAIGIAHDSSGFSWSVENLKHQWASQPTWVNALAVTSLVGTMIWPATRALRMSSQVGKLATAAGKWGGEAAEINHWKSAGLIGEDVAKYADLGDDPDKVLKLLRQQEMAVNRYTDMAKRADAVERGDITIKNPINYAMHQFEKRFANHYYEAVTTLGEGGGAKKLYHEQLDNLWQSDTIGSLLRNLPTEAAGIKVTAHLMERLNPVLKGRALKEFGALSKEEKLFVDMYEQAAIAKQKIMFDEGVISKAEFEQMGAFHLPALRKGTMNTGLDDYRSYLVPLGKGQKAIKTGGTLIEEEVPRTGLGRMFGKTKKVVGVEDQLEYAPITLTKLPRLDAPTLMPRKGTAESIFEDLKQGKLITDPNLMTANGYITDSLLHTNYSFIRDLVLDENNIATAADIAAWGGDMSKAAKAGFIPLSYAGSDAATRLGRMIAKKSGKEVEALPFIRKEIFKEVFGKDGMMEQARLAGSDMMSVATTIYKTMKTAGNIPTHLQNLTGNMVFLSQAGFNPTTPKNLALMGKMTTAFNKIAEVRAATKSAGLETSALWKGESPLLKNISFEPLKIGNRTFNLRDEFFDPSVRNLIEESAFDSVEGAGSLDKILGTLRKDQHATKAAINLYKKAKNVVQLNGKVKWFDNMTKAYLAEDMVPKMAYFMHLRGQGLTRAAAATEVARRLPMYGTVGSSIRYGRKFLFPWATFPAEALRITKNNIMDHPLRMLPWLRMPQITQSLVSGMGLGPETQAEVEASERQLPIWAQKPTTVLMSGGAAAGVGGAATGGILGAATGAILGKSGMAAGVGAAVGGTLGGMVAALTTDKEHEEQVRGALMDFLPHSTFLLSNTAYDFGGDMTPWQNVRGALEQMPSKPLAILQPLISIFSGEDQFGQPVQGNGVSKAIAGMVGFLSPPLIEKYGFKLTTPDVPAWGDPAGVTNVSRLMMDTGSSIDPMTGLPGSLSHDFLLNNFGTWKSYAATGERQLANELTTERNMGEVRSYLTKNLAYHIENGNDKEAVDILSEVQATFANQYIDDPRKAQNKFTEWQVKQVKTIGQHPMLRNWSQEELVERMQQVGAAGGEIRSQARDSLLKTIREELRIKGISGGSKPSGGLGGNPLQGDKSLTGGGAGLINNPLKGG